MKTLKVTCTLERKKVRQIKYVSLAASPQEF